MTISEQLRNHGLRVTRTRTAVLGLLQESDHALSQSDVERAITDDADRVTLFRVLQAFEDAGLAHKVLDTHGVARYAACAESCTTEMHHDTHAHFRCTICGNIFCLESIALPKVKVPKGFKVAKGHLDLEGSCSNCDRPA